MCYCYVQFQIDESTQAIKVQEKQSNPASDITPSQIEKMEKLELQLKNCQDALASSNEQVLVKDREKIAMEKELKTQAKLLDLEYQLEHEQDLLCS